jgi:hypothetical protein
MRLEVYIAQLESKYRDIIPEGAGIYAQLVVRTYGDVYVFRFTNDDGLIEVVRADHFDEEETT